MHEIVINGLTRCHFGDAAHAGRRQIMDARKAEAIRSAGFAA